MAGRIPQEFINSLIERADIVSVIGTRVELKRAGKSLKGLCPFHDEKTPSFNVNPDKQLYYCFGCGAGGTALTFLREYERLDFVEAVETLAGIIGVEVPRERGREPPRDTALYDILADADRTYRGWLRRHPTAHRATDYLKQRGLRGAVARDFGIGFAPEGWDGIKTALSNIGVERLIDAGLVVRNENGRTYDRFRDRIMFPIHDTRGRVVGFGGRVLGDEQPKYLNSPETDVFHKGQELYGLFEARQASRNLDSAIVVEGYMDVVGLAQHGVGGAVATLGTAIGETHFRKLFRHTQDVVCCFDGDTAGRQAAWKAVLAAFPALAEGRQLRFILLPDGEDPDSIVAREGSERFDKRVREAVPVAEYYFGELERGLNLARIGDRARLCDLALPDLATLPDGMFRRMMVERLAQTAQVEATQLEARLGQTGRPRAAARRTAAESLAEGAAMSQLMRKLLHMLVRQPACTHELDDHLRPALVVAAQGTLLQRLLEYLTREPDSDTATVLARFLSDPGYEELATLAAQPLAVPDEGIVAEFRDGVARLLQERRRAERGSRGGDSESTESLLERAAALGARSRGPSPRDVAKAAS
ncbi:MAG: DNA primase [Gammaproteobacteria bacterium]|nr:DNA primase [Gammaproteobacteria bacterium]MYB39494.1 DNA primase [Gammaproteobacteria bacterium]